MTHRAAVDLKNLISFIIGKPTPFVLNLEITSKCNSRCYYCDFWKRKTKDMSFKTYKKIIDEVWDLGVRISIINGGEALVRKDIVKILKYAHEKGLYLILLSNGLLIKRKFNEIKNYVNLYIISLDTLKPEVYNEIRGVKRGFELCMEGIKILKDNGKKLQLTCVVSEKNYKEIDSIIEFAEKNNIKIGFNPVNYAHKKNFKGTVDKRILNAYKKILKYKKQGKPITYSKSYYEHVVFDKEFLCKMKYLYLYVNSEGCLQLRCPFIKGNIKKNNKYNIKRSTIKELFYSKEAKNIRKIESRCNLCNLACALEPSLIMSKNFNAIKEYAKSIFK